MFVLEKFSDEEEKVAFYTVRSDEESEFSETEDFLIRMRQSDYVQQFHELMEFTFEIIGNQTGAHEDWFNRFERVAEALPPKKDWKTKQQAHTNEINFDIFNNKVRLYCLRLSDSVVVLFNGGVKLTTGRAEDDPNVSIHFRQANTYAQRIYDAISDGTIDIQHKCVVGYDGNDNNIYI
ncbi:hypothetical protein [Winogradskyella haliclonae]|uniref:Uncharacterized protein n=1 Tax=Winogradskyella haliclonae TaxID=2048558 RepID=A0ABQ2C1Y2_9FLAO|nr:hypothetical protein [Winogradskyella haliclonae]GGI58484.1 hypothetical protein GCM10011444_27930 [Winogradskyella haliclonae]